ncbi:c-type cytochrome [Methylobacterium variabile]|uniref:c-type cytochrome n=1 Tax=Methylobacterium variabile TaxID=298794 RepID=UPI0012EDD2F3|nr:c-type cytochrome [Methylobacterium variabile]
MRRSRVLALIGVGCLGAGLTALALSGPDLPPSARPGLADPAAVDVPAATFEPDFRPCAHCHQIGAGARHTTGPALTHVFGRAAGAVPGYPFSKAMRQSGLVWNAPTLARFLKDPQSVVPGTRMVFGGITDAAQLERAVEFLRQAGAEAGNGRAARPSAGRRP